MSYSFRKKIRRPQTAEEFFQGATPEKHNRDDPNSHDPSSPSSEEEDDRAHPVREIERYRGPVAGYNPNLPPAAFPSIDPCRSIEGHRAQEDGTAGARQFSSTAIQGDNRMQRSSASRKSSQRSSWDGMQLQHRAPMTDGIRGGGRRELRKTSWPGSQCDAEATIWNSKLNTEYKFGLEMVTSEEDDVHAHKNSTPAPSWSNLTDAQKLNLIDTMPQIRPRSEGQRKEDYIERIMIHLRLNRDERQSAKELMWKRQYRIDHEREVLRSTQCEVHGHLTDVHTGRRLTAEDYRVVLNKNFDALLGQDDYQISTRAEEAAARAYWSSCGFNPKLLDGDWASPGVNRAKAKSRESSPETATVVISTPSGKQKVSDKKEPLPSKKNKSATSVAQPSRSLNGVVEQPTARRPVDMNLSSRPSERGASSNVQITNARQSTLSPSQESQIQLPRHSSSRQPASAINPSLHSGTNLHGNGGTSRGQASFPCLLGGQSTTRRSTLSQADQLNASFRQAQAPSVNQPTLRPMTEQLAASDSSPNNQDRSQKPQPYVVLPSPAPTPPKEPIQLGIAGNDKTCPRDDQDERTAAVSKQGDNPPTQFVPEKRVGGMQGDGYDEFQSKKRRSNGSGGVPNEHDENLAISQPSVEAKFEKKSGKRGRPRKA